MKSYRAFRSKRAMKLSIKANGLEALNYIEVWSSYHDGEFVRPRFSVHLAEDETEIRDRGFEAVVDPKNAAGDPP